MRTLLIALALVCATAYAMPIKNPELTYKTDYQPVGAFQLFQDYIKDYQKQYASVEEFAERYVHFQENLQMIAELNRSNGLATYGVNKFTDMSPEEFKAAYLGFDPKMSTPPAARVRRPRRNLNATAVDWRTKGAVSAVKDQAQCGSCWAFSATEEIESMWFLGGHTMELLSPQQIVSCDTTDYGCQGGWTTDAFNYVKKAGGIEDNADYPYTSGGGVTGVCKVNSAKFHVKITGFEYATPPCQQGGSCTTQDETTMAKNCASTGPISVCVNAASWQFYTGGIITDNCPGAWDDLDHCVQVVGYNTSGSTQYWIVRNSWNTNWGEQGYLYVAVGQNLCGIADLATIVTV